MREFPKPPDENRPVPGLLPVIMSARTHFGQLREPLKLSRNSSGRRTRVGGWERPNRGLYRAGE